MVIRKILTGLWMESKGKEWLGNGFGYQTQWVVKMRGEQAEVRVVGKYIVSTISANAGWIGDKPIYMATLTAFVAMLRRTELEDLWNSGHAISSHGSS